MSTVISGFGRAIGGVFNFVFNDLLGLGGGSQTIQGARIGEVATQNSREGIPRPIVFGVARPIGGNIIASGRPIIRVVREKVSSGGGGKGGGGGGDVYQEREEVYRTYAIRICEGPVNAIRRVWRDNKLVYDSRAGAEGDPLPSMGPKSSRGGLFGSVTQAVIDGIGTQRVNNAEFLKTARFYLGGYDQMPDPALQREFGSQNVTAHRGTCYMVMDDEDLTPRRGSIPQYVFEVERGEGFALTSKPYPTEAASLIGVASHLITKQEIEQVIFPPPETDTFNSEASAVNHQIINAALEEAAKLQFPDDFNALVHNVYEVEVKQTTLVQEPGFSNSLGHNFDSYQIEEIVVLGGNDVDTASLDHLITNIELEPEQ